MTDLPAALILIVLGTQVPDGYAKVECPWAQAREFYAPSYIDNMPRFSAPGIAGVTRPNPDYYEFICVRPLRP